MSSISETLRIATDNCADTLSRSAVKHLESFGGKVDLASEPIGPKPKGKRGSKNAPQFDLRSELYRITGDDWTQVNGIDMLTAQTVITEAGADLKAFPAKSCLPGGWACPPATRLAAAKS